VIDRRTFLAGTGAVLLAAPLAAEGQQAAKVWRIGYLQGSTRKTQTHLIQAFEDGLRERGYTLGRDLVIESRFADGRLERLPELAAELVRLKVDVIVTGVNVGTVAAKKVLGIDGGREACVRPNDRRSAAGASPAARTRAGRARDSQLQRHVRRCSRCSLETAES
jgi:hypothetical protein